MQASELRELLELAAKAAGYEFGEINGAYKAKIEKDIGTCGTYGCQKHQWRDWNPLTDDGDALRLAVHMFRDIHFWYFDNSVSVGNEWRVVCGDDPCAATRLAIVRAAAEIGRSME